MTQFISSAHVWVSEDTSTDRHGEQRNAFLHFRNRQR